MKMGGVALEDLGWLTYRGLSKMYVGKLAPDTERIRARFIVAAFAQMWFLIVIVTVGDWVGLSFRGLLLAWAGAGLTALGVVFYALITFLIFPAEEWKSVEERLVRTYPSLPRVERAIAWGVLVVTLVAFAVFAQAQHARWSMKGSP